MFEVYDLAFVLTAVAAIGLAVNAAVSWFLRVDKHVDERQKTYSRLAAVFTAAQLPKMAEIGHCMAALAIKDSYIGIKTLVDSLEGEEELLLALRANFEWQTGKRLDTAQDRAKLLRAVANHPEAKVELAALLAEAAQLATK